MENPEDSVSKMETVKDFVSDKSTQMLDLCTNLAPSTTAAILDSPSWALALVVASIILPIVWIVFKIFSRIRTDAPNQIRAVKELIAPTEGPRFRKRDKIEFMGRRVFRNAKAVGSLIRGGQGKKRRAMARLVKKVFSRGSPEFQSQASMPGLPDEYLEEEMEEQEQVERIPRPLLIVFRNLRVFGHFDHKIFMELMKNIEYKTLKAHDSLFKIGESDENMYVVDSGAVNVYSTSKDPRTQEVHTNTLKKVRQGEAIFSLLSFVEYLGGRHKMYKTVSAKATEETRVIKITFQSFKATFDKYPETLAKVVQVVMVRLQRVTLLALHQYLGLGAELLSSASRSGEKMIRQSSQRQQDLEKLLKKQLSNPEAELVSPIGDYL